MLVPKDMNERFYFLQTLPEHSGATSFLPWLVVTLPEGGLMCDKHMHAFGDGIKRSFQPILLILRECW